MKPRQAGDAGSHEPESFSQWLHTWRYLFWLLGLVVLGVLFYAEENWRGARAWRIYKEQMSARGESFEPKAFIPPHVPDEENFAMTPAVATLFGFLPGTQGTGNPTATYQDAASLVKSKPGTLPNSWVGSRTDLALWAAAFAAGTNRNRREALVVTNFDRGQAAAAVLRSLAEYGPLLEGLRAASTRPYCRFNIHYEDDNPAGILLPHLSQVKRYCLVLQLRASAELALGRTDEALQDVLLMFYLADTSRGEPILISHLVRMSELYLALQPLAEGMGKWSEPQLRALQQRLEQFDFCADMKRALRAERTLFGIGIIEWVRRSSEKMKLLNDLQSAMSNGPGEWWPMGPMIAAAPDGWLCLEERNQSRAFDEYLLPLVDVTNRLIRPSAVRQAEAAINRLTEGSPGSRFLHHQYFNSILLPAISRVAQKAAFGQTAVDLATLACALERFRLAHGQLPDSLAKLCPELIARLPHDIINGQPLQYHAEPDGHYLLYSVGWNAKDDGGQPARNPQNEMDHKEGDWVWGAIFE